jgi:SAM-dependent methyltransferase
MITAMARDDRSPERLRAHWDIERELADRLRSASRDERTALYGTVYDELFRRVPDHPQLVWAANPEQRRAEAARAAALVRQFLPPGGVFLEIGAGDCSLSLSLCPHARRVYAVEVSREIASVDSPPDNFELLITDGRSIPVQHGTVDLAYSNQLMEHLHPDDAIEQLAQISATLRPGGRYICLTPNRLLGPGDISMYFEEDVARGFHLREYSNGELRDVMRRSGFARVDVLGTLRGRAKALPIWSFLALERVFEVLPRTLRRRLKRTKLVRKALSPGGGVIATKSGPGPAASTHA